MDFTLNTSFAPSSPDSRSFGTSPGRGHWQGQGQGQGSAGRSEGAWYETFNKRKGKAYWTNRVTGEKTWDRPEGV